MSTQLDKKAATAAADSKRKGGGGGDCQGDKYIKRIIRFTLAAYPHATHAQCEFVMLCLRACLAVTHAGDRSSIDMARYGIAHLISNVAFVCNRRMDWRIMDALLAGILTTVPSVRILLLGCTERAAKAHLDAIMAHVTRHDANDHKFTQTLAADHLYIARLAAYDDTRTIFCANQGCDLRGYGGEDIVVACNVDLKSRACKYVVLPQMLRSMAAAAATTILTIDTLNDAADREFLTSVDHNGVPHINSYELALPLSLKL